MRRVLVTGGAGFIGHHLVHALLARGEAVTVLDDFSSGGRDALPKHPKLRVLEGDVCDASAVAEALQGCEAVAHLAAMVAVPEVSEKPGRAWEVNVHASLALWRAAKAAGVQRFVFASSSAVYGDGTGAACRELDGLAPRSLYGAQKAAVDEAIRSAGDASMHGVALRLFNVFGPGQQPKGPYSSVITAFAEGLRAGAPLRIDGDGEQTRDFVHVSDVAEFFARALAPEFTQSGAWNVGTGTAITIRALAETVHAIMGDSPLRVVEAPARSGDIRHSFADNTEASRVFGYVAEQTLEDGLRALLL